MNPSVLAIFDIDGTLFQSHRATVPAVRQAFEHFALTPPDEAAIIDTFGVPVVQYEAWLASLAPKHAQQLVAYANDRELALIGETGELYPGVVDTLVRLRDAGHVLATCSNGSTAYVDAVLDAHALRPFFEAVCCLGQCYADKAAMVQHILAEINVRPAVVIGDRRGDIDAAQANRIASIAATYGYGAEEEWHGAGVRVSSIIEVPHALTQLVRP